jgi:rSAM/selenodomain-associated transferase 2
MDCSIIIPVIDESAIIASRVEACRALRPRPEVIVADGGSADATRELAEAAGARVVLSPRRGRAFQMNAGAAASGGDLLIFLHTDVDLSQAAYDAMRESLRDPALIGGAFRRRFDSASRLLALGCRLADLRGRWLHLYLGDQAIFARRATFEALRGFPEILLFEDLAFSRNLARLGRTRLIDAVVMASGRRFAREGTLRRLGGNCWLALLYLLGNDPNRLALRYYPTLAVPPATGKPLSGRGREGWGPSNPR